MSDIVNKKILEKIEKEMKKSIKESQARRQKLKDGFEPNLSGLLKDDIETFKQTGMTKEMLAKKEEKKSSVNIELVDKNGSEEEHKSIPAPVSKEKDRAKISQENNEKEVKEQEEKKPEVLEVKEKSIVAKEEMKKDLISGITIKEVKEKMKKMDEEKELECEDLFDIDFKNLFDLENEKKAISNIIEHNNQMIEDQKKYLQEDIKDSKSSLETKKRKTAPLIVDNFSYVKEKNESLYNLLKHAESLLITDHVRAAQIAFREGFSRFVIEVIRGSGKEADFKEFYEMIEQHKLENLEDARDSLKCFFIENQKLLGENFFYSSKSESADEDKMSFDDLRKLGDLSLHIENLADNKKFVTEKEGKSILSGKILRQTLFTFNEAMQAHYRIDVPYDENYLKLSDYDIYKYANTTMGKEYYGVNQETNPNTYAIIRQYSRDNADLNFVQRNVDALTRIDNNTFERISGIAEIKQLNKVNVEDEDYYVAYLFKRKPLRLNQENLSVFASKENKLQLCCHLSKTISQLHNLPEPIYHRLINPNAVVLGDFTDLGYGYMPFLINFDFSKFKDADSNKTVVQHLNDAIASMKSEEEKNLEYVCAYDTKDVSYEKMDIYALGVLFKHILLGDLEKNVSLEQIEKEYSEKIADLLEMMTNEEAIYRPKAQEVFEVFEKVFTEGDSKNEDIVVVETEVKSIQNSREEHLDAKTKIQEQKIEKNEQTTNLEEIEQKVKDDEQAKKLEMMKEKLVHMKTLEQKPEAKVKEDSVQEVVKQKPDLSNRKEMNAVEPFDNFGYMKQRDTVLYNNLKKAERLLLTDHMEVAKVLARDVLDPFLNTVLKNENLANAVVQLRNKENKYKAKNISNVEPAAKINYIARNPKLSKVIPRNDCMYIKNLGNKTSHSGGYVSFTREQLVKGLSYFHGMSRAYYKLKEEEFNPSYMCLGEFDIYGCIKNSNLKKTGCVGEFYGVKNGRASKDYAIIRQYKKGGIDKEFIQRNISTLEQIKENSIDGIRGVAEIKELNSIKMENEDYYIAYIFHREPFRLSQKVLNKVETDFEKVQMCYRISESVNTLHHLAQPIYHRMINPNAIVLCNYGNNGYIPFLIGFDFSKFENQNNFKTVVQSWQSALNSMKDELDYICDDDPSNISYEKLDIYALGVLFIRILCGSLQKDVESAFDSVERKYSTEIADLLDAMTSPEPDQRPDARDVFAVFEKAYKEYK